MSEIPASLRVFRGQLFRAVARDLTRPRRPTAVVECPQLRGLLGLVACAAGSIAAAGLTVAAIGRRCVKRATMN